jgi:transcriptional regulator with XRE-family HTH domain
MMALYIAAEGLEQKKIAEEVGIGESTLSRFLSGQALPAADAYARLLAWCSGVAVPDPPGSMERIAKLEAQVEGLHQRTFPMVRMGGTRR